ASDYARISTPFEGYDVREIAGKPVSVTFFVNSTKTGTYCVSLTNGTQSVAVDYSISSASTWEIKTVTFPPIPTSGTWDYSNGASLYMNFTLAAGSSFQETGNAWSSINAYATSNQTNFLTSAGNTFKLSGVQLVEGAQAVPLINENYMDVLNKC